MYSTGIINQYGVYFVATNELDLTTLSDCETLPFAGHEAAFYQRVAEKAGVDVDEVGQGEFSLRKETISDEWLLTDNRGIGTRIDLDDYQHIGEFISRYEV